MPVYIYVLIDPRDESIFYVGQTEDLTRRLNGHIAQSRAKHTKKAKTQLYIREMLKTGSAPAIEMVEAANVFNCYLREQSWYDVLKACGFKLTNLARPCPNGKTGRGIKRKSKTTQKHGFKGFNDDGDANQPYSIP